MQYIVIREYSNSDIPGISEVIRNAYISNVYYAWTNAVFDEITFELITLVAACQFIFFNMPIHYCLLAIPIVLIMLYIIIYGSLLMKSAEVMYNKRPLQCWVAEAFEPFLFMKKPEEALYKIIPVEKIADENFDESQYQRKIIGTVAVMRHNLHEEWAWLFRLGVDKRYRRKGVGLQLILMVQNWCRSNRFNNIELAMSDCQYGARHLFAEAGFDIKQMYHKRLLTSAVTLQMYQLNCEVRPTF